MMLAVRKYAFRGDYLAYAKCAKPYLAYTTYRAAKFRSLNFLSLFRDLQKPTRFGGGGVVGEFFRDPKKPTRFGGGGGVV